ncbi:hypothetical protein MLD38_003820 [Melastoma candidum]|uniref:Uncharacterized protein n=1 Tax=Melastoma candidum TaxID=119954 RepID=A0ACB9S3N4_9MYRT|nr:hypothetical protein MLD38_003820 [Melastoma candidum]
MEFCNSGEDDSSDLRRGSWTREEDNLLTRYIVCHGEGRAGWNLLAMRVGLKRNGKSCRLRWLNYLKPDIKRGNLTAEEQLLILNLHHKWGNRWSKIAQYLPGRTDNEIKNYWRTRVQKQARQLSIYLNNKRLMDTLCSYWIPRLFTTTTEQDPTQTFGCHNYFDDFDSGYNYDAEELSALATCNALTSEFPVDEAAEGLWDVDVDYDIWRLRNSDNLGFRKIGWFGHL